jgi:hypothetical protein
MTRLKYNARAQVGGKMAQVGSRLIDAAAGKITDDFFKAFEAHLQAATAGAPVPEAVPAAGGSKTLWWVVGAVIVLAIIYFISR